MKPQATIVVTGAAGFIGSCLVALLNSEGHENIILVDDFSSKTKAPNLLGKKYCCKVHRDQFSEWWDAHPDAVDAVYHLGARTDTTEPRYDILKALNLDYSKWIWEACTTREVPLVYASSAATYGAGELGYSDDEQLIPDLQPLNEYGRSKNEFDIWALEQKHQPPFWAGLKFFNVYGPNEYHKGRMASVIFHAVQQIHATGSIKLFRSHHPDFEDGGQLRDFIYVNDVLSVCIWLMTRQPQSGIFNLGTGRARTFNDLALAVFAALEQTPKIDFIDTPADIRDKYQYFTQADMSKLKKAGYTAPFESLEQGIANYVRHFLLPGRYR